MTKHEQAVRLSLRKHFETSGVRFDLSPEEVEEQLEAMMEPSRFDEWCSSTDALLSGVEDCGNRYTLLHTASEWSCCFSQQADLMLEAACWLAGKVSKHQSEKSVILDLGCGSGVLTSWLATKHSSCQVIGVDCLENALSAAREQRQPKNLAFQLWDYRNQKPATLPCGDLLVCSLGIDFSLIDRHDTLDADRCRTGEMYTAKKREALAYFASWREATLSNGRLFAVLRVPGEKHFLAVVDAAHESGWVFKSSESTKLTCGPETLPALVFEAGTAELASEDELLAFWAESEINTAFGSPLFGGSALLIFRLLGDKRILETGRKSFDDGHTMLTMLGTAGGIAFSFSHATTGFSRLEMVSLTQRERLKMRFSWND